MILDLRGAYDCPTLRKLEREFIFDRSGNGSLTITDTVEFSEPTEYESALITSGEVTELEQSLRFADGDTAITIDYTADNVALQVSSDTINQPPHPTRVAISTSENVSALTLCLVIQLA
jgi:hypothetical protein